MATYSRRFQMLFSEEQWKAIQKACKVRGLKTADLIRRAVDKEVETSAKKR